MKAKIKRVIPVPWCDPGNYNKMQEISDPSDSDDTSYDRWLEDAERRVAELKAKGAEPEKVFVNADQYWDWCLEKGLELNAESRERYMRSLQPETPAPRHS